MADAAAQSITPGNLIKMFDAKAVETGGAPYASAIMTLEEYAGLQGAGMQAIFDADPGAFELQLQVSNESVAATFVSVAALTGATANGTNYVAFTHVPGTYARYLRIVLVSVTNAVNLTAWVKR